MGWVYARIYLDPTRKCFLAHKREQPTAPKIRAGNLLGKLVISLCLTIMWNFNYSIVLPVPNIPLSYMETPEILFFYCAIFLPVTPKHQVIPTTTLLFGFSLPRKTFYIY